MRGSRVVDHAGDGILVEDHFKQHLDAMFGLSDAEMDRCAALPAEPVQAVTAPTVSSPFSLSLDTRF